MRYKTPRALEQAVKAAAIMADVDTNKAIARFYHDRFLCRVFAADKPAFVLKGGQSMLAKIITARETRDVDLLYRSPDLDEALAELKRAATVDLGDFIEFRFRDARPTDTSQDYREGYTARFDAWLGGTKRVGVVSVDLIVDPMPPEEFEVLTPLGRLGVPDLVCFDYITCLPETRIAEKVCAIMQAYASGPSSRVKDLADLATSMLNERVVADRLAKRLYLEAAFRHMEPIERLAVPDTWKTTFSGNYRKVAREAKLPRELEGIAAAEAAIADWIQPALEGDAEGCIWNPESQVWM